MTQSFSHRTHYLLVKCETDFPIATKRVSSGRPLCISSKIEADSAKGADEAKSTRNGIRAFACVNSQESRRQPILLVLAGHNFRPRLPSWLCCTAHSHRVDLAGACQAALQRDKRHSLATRPVRFRLDRQNPSRN